MTTYDSGDNGFTKDQLTKLAASFEKHLNLYCVDWMLKRGAVTSCEIKPITAAEKAAAIKAKYGDHEKDGNFKGVWKNLQYNPNNVADVSVGENLWTIYMTNTGGVM
jgi:hypothetical protein